MAIAILVVNVLWICFHMNWSVSVVATRLMAAMEKSKEHAMHEGVAIARETLSRVRGRVAGVQVSAPLGRVDLALDVFEGLVAGASAI